MTRGGQQVTEVMYKMASMDWKTFFEKTKVPDNYDIKLQKMQDFSRKQISQNRKVVVISSGGTAVPLESKTVRFIDNFSVGTRGSVSTECFLDQNYAVIFLYRNRTLQPFLRHFSRVNFFDVLKIKPDNDSIEVQEEKAPGLRKILEKYNKVQANETLLSIEFTTLADYLYLLKAAGQALQPYGKRGMFYLAAAVSDFYIPSDQMPEHKIQSSDGPLQLSLQLVPKMLSPLVTEWAPTTYVVSFKLETDPGLLVKKAKQALTKYKHQVVIANLLETRKKEVVMVTPEAEKKVEVTEEEMQAGLEIEQKIISELVHLHQQAIESAQPS